MAAPNVAKTQNSSTEDPNSPENRVDPRWAQQMQTMQEAVMKGVAAAINPKTAIVEKGFNENREDYCTKEEAEKYDRYVDKDFVETDTTKKKAINPKTFYRIIHWFPEYQTANPNEFRGKFVIEKWHHEVDPLTKQKRRVMETSMHVFARDFLKNHKTTIPDVEAEDAEEQ